MITLQWLFLILLSGVLAYHRAPRWLWIPLLALPIALDTYDATASAVALSIAWLFWLVATVMSLVPDARKYIFSAPIWNYFRKALPPLSITEREAIDAGDVWWEGELFNGSPNFSTLHAIPKPTLTAHEEAFLSQQVPHLCSLLNDWEIVHERGDLSVEAWDYLKSERFFGMNIPVEHGGLGFSPFAQSTIISTIGTRSTTAATIAMVPNSLGPGELIVHYGTSTQKQYYLPRLARGEEIPCFGLTSHEAGSDAGSIIDKGIVCYGEHEGKRTLGMLLTFHKRYITLAPVATVIGLAIKAFDPDHLIGSQTDLGITLCLLPANHSGINIGRRHYPMGMTFMNGPISGEDVFIPLDWIIGGSSMIGQGWRMLMECLSIGRGISLPASASAGGALAHLSTSAYARLREQFHMPVGKFEGIQLPLARIGGLNYILQATRVFTASATLQGAKPAIASAIAKYHMTEFARQAVNDALDIHAGRAVQIGPRNYLAHTYWAMPIGITVEGANILTRNLIVYGQGSVRCHPYVRHEMEAAGDVNSERGFRTFDRLLIKHVGYFISNLVRTIWLSLTAARFVIPPKNAAPFRRVYQNITRLSSTLAWISDLSMLLLGGSLKRKESLSARLGDVLSNLYLLSAVLKFFRDNGSQREEIPYVQWSTDMLLARADEAFHEYFRNFPNPMIGKIMKWIAFPWGQAYLSPKDRLAREIATQMQKPSTVRSHLTNLCYLGTLPKDPLAALERAFHMVCSSENTAEAIKAAQKKGILSGSKIHLDTVEEALAKGIIDVKSAEAYCAAESARYAALDVDDFPFDYFNHH